MSARLKSTTIVKHDTVGEVVTQNASYSVTRSMCVCVCGFFFFFNSKIA